MKNPLSIILAGTFGVLIVLLGIGVKFPTHLYSPGDLCKDHQGIKSCKQCHVPFKGPDSRLCMSDDCHTTGRLSQLSHKSLSDLHVLYANKECLDCHTEHKGISGKITRSFDHKTLTSDILNECAACHEDDYKKAHPAKYNMDCKSCHISTSGWKIISFNHNTIQGKTPCINCHQMPGDKRHEKVPETCETCHTTKDWKDAHFNHDTLEPTQACVECHKKPADNIHVSVSDDCRTCHSTNKWKPATFDHDKYFPLTGDHDVSCNTCHENGDCQRYTCLNCHEHNTPHIRHEHEEHGIHDYGDCLRCHQMKIHGKVYGNPEAEGVDEGEEREGGDDD
ncbi:MAG: hypothetical protein U0586_08020 [Candidatus Brocadiaceae bacterium]